MPKIFTMIFFAVLILAGPAHGNTLYVTDELEITMRTGPSLQHRVINMLSSGASLEVLDETTDWLHIRIPDGREGWVLKRYTMQRQPWALMVRQLEDKTGELQDRTRSSEQKAAVLEQENTGLQAELQDVRQQLESLRREHQTLREDSGNIEGIKQELQTTKDALRSDREQLGQLRQENQDLRSQKNLQWFLAGGGAMAFTALMGFVLGRIQRKKIKRTYL